MKEEKYIYELETKQRIREEDIIPGKPYIVYFPNDKWKIRKVVFNKDKSINKEEYVNIKDKMEIMMQKIRQSLEKQGCEDIEIYFDEKLEIENFRINVDNYHVSYKDSRGTRKERILNTDTLEDMIINDKDGITVNISHATINSALIGNTYDETVNKDESIMSQDDKDEGNTFKREKRSHVNRRKENTENRGTTCRFKDCNFNKDFMSSFDVNHASNTTLQFDQFGYKAQYDLSKQEDRQRLFNDIPDIIKGKEQENSRAGNE